MDRPAISSSKAALAGFGAGCVFCGLVVLFAGAVVIQMGLFDVSARDPHGALAAWATHTTMIYAERRRARTVVAPPHFTTAQIAAGARLYDTDCTFCHGAPGIARNAWTAGMTPPPPYLLDAARHWTGPELFAIVGDGVKMTGMPAWRVTRSDQDIWNLVAFLEALPYISPRDYGRFTSRAPAPTPGRS